ncbi:MAG: NADH-quinone oxidoreductase subunit NuoK [Gammaproteobacteria bacterium]|nr:NADH-quinone oxidoreductase subunit NuoK [Gammaproteobacteria bacterium]MCH9716618.1 NADH-quinone oxidoreductase subunit NuoK [Gammaproteobacteria bacterium]MCH9763980.1 NADH-quinone oxidoreductase subunit NuoK [Gammaproteobacteria bacterium]
MIPATHYLILSGILFAISLFGMVINRRNVITLLICVELMLLAVNTNFVAFSSAHGGHHGEAFVFFILTVAAAEAAIGLAIVLLVYRHRGSIAVDEINQLKG